MPTLNIATRTHVIPAKAGIQIGGELDSRFFGSLYVRRNRSHERGNDGEQ